MKKVSAKNFPNFVKALCKAKALGSGGEKDWEFGVSRCKLLYIRWLNNKVLLSSTWNYIQFPVTNYNRKNI